MLHQTTRWSANNHVVYTLIQFRGHKISTFQIYRSRVKAFNLWKPFFYIFFLLYRHWSPVNQFTIHYLWNFLEQPFRVVLARMDLRSAYTFTYNLPTYNNNNNTNNQSFKIFKSPQWACVCVRLRNVPKQQQKNFEQDRITLPVKQNPKQ